MQTQRDICLRTSVQVRDRSPRLNWDLPTCAPPLLGLLGKLKQLGGKRCVLAAAAGSARGDVVREAHLFLQEQGGINTGLLQNDPLAAAAAAPAVTTERIAAETLRILRSVDMAVRSLASLYGLWKPVARTCPAPAEQLLGCCRQRQSG